jgi:hypothetical protein
MTTRVRARASFGGEEVEIDMEKGTPKIAIDAEARRRPRIAAES